MADGRFDDLLMNMARKHKNVEELTWSMLSFFERRTDLFHVMETPTDRMGFVPGAAEKMLFKHFHLCPAPEAPPLKGRLLHVRMRIGDGAVDSVNIYQKTHISSSTRMEKGVHMCPQLRSVHLGSGADILEQWRSRDDEYLKVEDDGRGIEPRHYKRIIECVSAAEHSVTAAWLQMIVDTGYGYP
ncbi:NudC domain-containing protein 3 [Symbiodinium microadriaticum]|uniref:NudC domain-containing protein 3 n=1 Tax=Symbiodinium microadriaticum TaxID=2951 RepID=A0A1Q9E381_SYMMI|nr:NudC domain-containing protein 3 [Symbiodinium microadriaticum]